MSWKYKHHDALCSILSLPERIIRFLIGISWLYAHYRNGEFPYQYPDNPRLFFKERTLFENIKQEWEDSIED